MYSECLNQVLNTFLDSSIWCTQTNLNIKGVWVQGLLSISIRLTIPILLIQMTPNMTMFKA